MNTPEGFNGDTAFSARDIPVGHRGARLVTVSVHMEWLTRRSAYETVDHEQVIRPLEFSITTTLGRDFAGASVEPLTEITRYAGGYDKASAAELVKLSEWHMNSMSPACSHQKRYAGLDSAPCPVTGYRWGTAWLIRSLPEGFLDRTKALFDLDHPNVWSAK